MQEHSGFPPSLSSTLYFSSFGSGATKAVIGAFSTDATGFGLLNVSAPSTADGTTHFLVNVDRLDDSGTLIRTVALVMEAEAGPSVLTVYTYNETYSTSGVDISGEGGNVTLLDTAAWYIEAPHTSAFTAVGRAIASRRAPLFGPVRSGNLERPYRTNPKDLRKYLLPGTRCVFRKKKIRKKNNFWRHALRKNGFRKKKSQKLNIFLPIFDAVVKFCLLLIQNTQRKN